MSYPEVLEEKRIASFFTRFGALDREYLSLNRNDLYFADYG
jgi:hypothetical protein